MRIGLVIPSFDPRRGGAEQWTWQFARLLASGARKFTCWPSHFGSQAEDVAARAAPAAARTLADLLSPTPRKTAARRLSLD